MESSPPLVSRERAEGAEPARPRRVDAPPGGRTQRHILHITADYPDAVSTRKTLAVRNLVESADVFAPCVYSINRRGPLGAISVVARDVGVTSLTYGAPPYGVLLETFLDQLADWIVRDVRARGVTVDVVHAHKFSIEGLAARRVAAALDLPFLCSARGNTDKKYLWAKPGKLPVYRRLAREANALLPVTPWIARYLEDRLGPYDTPVALLPTMSGVHDFQPSVPCGGPLVTAFDLTRWRQKGMPKLLAAIASLDHRGVKLELDVYGGGGEAVRRRIGAEIQRLGLVGRVRLMGRVEQHRMGAIMNEYAGFVLPTMHETFGMVFLEALFAGIPVLYPRDRGIDGYFDDLEIGYRCDPRMRESIADGLIRISTEEARLKANIRALAAAGTFDRFRAPEIRKRYIEVVESVCAGRS
jgi:glycosyltransferase involved in cell wall biosynthesis